MKSDDELITEIIETIDGAVDDVLYNDFSDFFGEEPGDQNPDGTWQPTKGWRPEDEFDHMKELAKKFQVDKSDPHTIVIRYVP